MIGLVRRLSLTLRLLALVECVVQRELHQQQTTLASLYEGNLERSTSRPTADRLLRAFQPITLTAVTLPDRRILHLTVLTSGSLACAAYSDHNRSAQVRMLLFFLVLSFAYYVV